MIINKPIKNDDSLDILSTYFDALELVHYEGDDEQRTFSEYSVRPPEYMVKAANKALKIKDKESDSKFNDLTRTKQIANKYYLTLSVIKRIKELAKRHLNGSEERKTNTNLLLWGIPNTEAGLLRVIAWADRQIKKSEK